MMIDTLREKMNGGFYYLASPYSHVDKEIEAARYREVIAYAAMFFDHRINVMSPIMQCHDMSRSHKLPSDAETWRDYNRALINASSGMIIATIDGWLESLGITSEINYCREINKPIILANIKSKHSPLPFIRPFFGSEKFFDPAPTAPEPEWIDHA